jgi:hypothetical protein
MEPYVQHTKPTYLGDERDREVMRTWQLHYLVTRSPSTYHPDLQTWGPLRVPVRSVAVFGDNRDGSYDTRYVGFIPFGSLIGRLVRIWSPSRKVVVWTRDSTIR